MPESGLKIENLTEGFGPSSFELLPWYIPVHPTSHLALLLHSPPSPLPFTPMSPNQQTVALSQWSLSSIHPGESLAMNAVEAGTDHMSNYIQSHPVITNSVRWVVGVDSPRNMQRFR